MDTSSNLSSNHLRHGLAQILQCYSSCGLRYFNTTSAVSISPEVLMHLSNLGKSAPAHAQEPVVARPAQVEAAGRTEAAPIVQAPRLKSERPEVPPPVAEAPVALPSSLLPVGNWQLPNMEDSVRQSKLQELDAQVKACRKCSELVCYRRQTVFGEGNVRPRLCFFGEAPGADEDIQGRPFVGAAGRLLTDIIRAMKLQREEVYILNSLKCRPPQNRTPLPEEVDNCRPYALTQLEILQPEFIILLGAVAVRSVLQSTESVGRLRGRFHHFHGARVLVTYHPAYLLRNPDAKKLVWQDVQMVMREMGLA